MSHLSSGARCVWLLCLKQINFWIVFKLGSCALYRVNVWMHLFKIELGVRCFCSLAVLKSSVLVKLICTPKCFPPRAGVWPIIQLLYLHILVHVRSIPPPSVVLCQHGIRCNFNISGVLMAYIDIFNRTQWEYHRKLISSFLVEQIRDFCSIITKLRADHLSNSSSTSSDWKRLEFWLVFRSNQTQKIQSKSCTDTFPRWMKRSVFRQAFLILILWVDSTPTLIIPLNPKSPMQLLNVRAP